MKKKIIALSMLVGLGMALGTIMIQRHYQEKQEVKTVSDQYYAAAKKENQKSGVKDYLKPAAPDNSDITIYRSKQNNKYYFIKSKEVGIDTKSPIVVNRKGQLLGKSVYIPSYDTKKIKYKPYVHYYEVDLSKNNHSVTLVDHKKIEGHIGSKVYESHKYNVKHAVKSRREITQSQISKNPHLLNAAIIYYGYSEISQSIGRWNELAESSSGWKVYIDKNGRHLAYENRHAKQSDLKLRPNEYRIQGNQVTYESFIVHSNGEVMKKTVSLQTILNYVNRDQDRVAEVYKMEHEISIENLK
ncbi:hypothetical protein D3P96_07665 [Weissella viridescens]|uniref:Uncharacterized protein n=1 Tax=Weissella viridescens TaxID=1629 RepID=A0A3P2RI85_WEIVI|nr:hypothetical protein [Weissella viridescens]RRG17422.1 hypothetical protein D3P96_07665 [Weissella viridescens]